MFCKTIILSNSENLSSNAPKGILTLSKDNNLTLGKIRLYNLNSLPQGIKVGLYINEKVIISPIIKKPNHYEFELNNNIDITQSIYCALIDTHNNKNVLLEGGSSNGFCFTDSPFDALIEAKDEELEQNINKALSEVEACENCNCANCEYKKYFYQNYSPINQAQDNQDTNNIVNLDIENSPNTIDTSQDLNQNQSQNNLATTFEQIDNIQENVINTLNNELVQDIDNITSPIIDTSLINDSNIEPQHNTPQNSEDTINNEDSSNKLDFLNEIVEQLDIMFEQNPPDDMLNSIIPNSRFVKVKNESPYVLGVIYENEMLKYIAYGVPAQYNDLPPIDLGQHYQWLPLNPRDVMSDGYFMIYQDALTGSLVEINFE